MPGIEETMESVKDFKKSMDQVKTYISTVDDIDSLVDLEDSIGLRNCAELNVGLAFAVSSLYFMMLKSKGMDTANHPIKDDLKRIKEYVARIRKLDGGIEGIAQKKRKIAVDSVAANRMIKHELSANYDNPSSISCSDSTVHDIEESTMCNDKSFQTNDELSTQQKKKKRKKAKNR